MMLRDIPLFLAHARMDGNTRKVALPKKLVKLCSPEGALDEDDDLIEFQTIEQLIQLPILLRFAELDIVLLKAM